MKLLIDLALKGTLADPYNLSNLCRVAIEVLSSDSAMIAEKFFPDEDLNKSSFLNLSDSFYEKKNETDAVLKMTSFNLEDDIEDCTDKKEMLLNFLDIDESMNKELLDGVCI